MPDFLSPFYVQFTYLSANMCRYIAIYTAGTAGICIEVRAGTGTGTGADIRTGTGRFGKFGTTSIPVPETSVSSVRYQYRRQKIR